MTIQTSAVRKAGPFAGNDAATAFPFSFKVFAATDLQVIETLISTGFDTTLTLASGYAVTLNSDQENNPGGVITYQVAGTTTPLPSTKKLTVLSVVPATQTLDLTNRGGFFPEVIEKALDRLTILVQQAFEKLGRALFFPATDPAGLTLTIPSVSARAGRALGFGVDGSVTLMDAVGALFTALFGGISRTVTDRLADTLSVKDFGAKGDGVTDDTAAINTAIAAATALGCKTLFFPAGHYLISTQIVITSALVLQGDGSNATFFRQATNTAGGFNFNFPTYTTGGGLRGLTIEAGAGYEQSGHAFAGSGSSGIGVRVTLANDGFSVNDVYVANFDTGVALAGCFNSHWMNCRVLFFRTVGLVIDKGLLGGVDQIGGDNRFTIFKIGNNGYSGDNSTSIGLLVKSSGGEHFYSTDVTKTNTGFALAPPAGANNQVLYLWFYGCLADTCVNDGWVFDGTNNKVWSIQLVNCWGAFSTNGSGLTVKGTNVDSIRWVGGRLRENGAAGVNLLGGVNFSLDSAEVAANSTLTASLSPGVNVAAGVSFFAILNSRIGNFASTFTTQGDGITIAAGASGNFRIAGNDLSSPGAGKVPLNSGATTLTYIITDNLPIQSGVDEKRGGIKEGNTIGTVAAATTVFLGINAEQASEVQTLMLAGRPCVVHAIDVQVDAAPGAGQTFIYTLRRNGADTGATGTISGAGVFSVSFAIPVLLGSTDNYCLKLVTSAGAAATRHRWNMKVDS